MSSLLPTSWLSSISKIFEPIQQIDSANSLSEFLAQFGWDVSIPPGGDFANIQAAMPFVTYLQNIIKDIEKIATDSEDAIPNDIADLISNIKSVFSTLQSTNATNFFSKSTSTSKLVGSWQNFSIEMIDYLVFNFLQKHLPSLYGILSFFGVLQQNYVPANAAIGRGAYLQRQIKWENLSKIFTNMSDLITKVFGWGSTQFSQVGQNLPGSAILIDVAEELLGNIGLNVGLTRPDDLSSFYDAKSQYVNQAQALHFTIFQYFDTATNSFVSFDLDLFPIPIGTKTDPPSGLALEAALSAESQNQAQYTLGPITISLTSQLQGSVGLTLQISPDGVSLIGSASGTINESATVTLATPILIGDPTGCRFEIDAFQARLFVSGNTNDIEYGVEIAAQGAKIVIESDGTDGFLNKVLPSDPMELDFDLTIGFSNKKKFYVKGAGSLAYDIPIHQSLGPISIDNIGLKLALQDNETDLLSTISGGVTLGPVSAEVDGIGLKTAFTFGGQNGLLGPLDLKFGFKPPDGLGLSIDAGPVTGAGYIQRDCMGEYAGIFQLKIDIPVESIEITVIGILDTKLPGGVPGYSFLIIVTSEFTPIELGFGFTLNGVGGLAGINRSMSLDALRAGIKNHSLDSVLFPPDPIIPKAPQIISQISSIFPVTERSYVFGIMLELGWGEPQIIDAELGIILELPDPVNIALLGNFKAGFPSVEDPDLAIVFLQIDVLGIIDFEHQQFTFQAGLYDSRVVVFQITGGLSMLLDWSRDHSQLIVAAGGFNPHFSAPPGFPVPDPIAMGIHLGPVSISFKKNYFAVTSNSVQAGAHLEISAGASGFGLYGHLGFDTVFIFHPFSFDVEMSAGVSILAGGTVLFCVELDGSLSGPKPWHVHASASFTIIFVTISIPVDLTIGDPADSQPVSQIAVLPLLQAGLQSKSAWSTQLPSAVDQLVTFGKAPSGDQTLYVHPMGSITVRQKIVPLDTQIDKFGTSKPSDGSYYNISGISVNTQSQTVPSATDIEDEFARGQFQHLSDSDQISKPSFEEMPSGTHIGSTDFQTNNIPNQELDLTYDTYYIETPIQAATVVKDEYHPSLDVLAASVGLGPSANSPARNIGAWKYVPPGITPAITVQPQKYAVVSTETLSPVAGIVPEEGSSMTAAEGALQTHLSAHPEDAGQLQVVPVQEAQAA